MVTIMFTPIAFRDVTPEESQNVSSISKKYVASVHWVLRQSLANFDRSTQRTYCTAQQYSRIKAIQYLAMFQHSILKITHCNSRP